MWTFLWQWHSFCIYSHVLCLLGSTGYLAWIMPSNQINLTIFFQNNLSLSFRLTIWSYWQQNQLLTLKSRWPLRSSYNCSAHLFWSVFSYFRAISVLFFSCLFTDIVLFSSWHMYKILLLQWTLLKWSAFCLYVGITSASSDSSYIPVSGCDFTGKIQKKKISKHFS